MDENNQNAIQEKYPLALRAGTVLAGRQGDQILCRYEIIRVLAGLLLLAGMFAGLKFLKTGDKTEIPAPTSVPKPAALLSLSSPNTIVGQYVTFGNYEQDNNASNGAEPIEWLVLDKKDGKALLISRYGLESRVYSTKSVDITWKNCTLRKWLNSDFLNTAFTPAEQKKIADTKVSADKNPKYSTDPGKTTTDKIFLLSLAEAEEYFPDNNSRICAPTAFAKARGAWTSNDYQTADGEAACWWRLRSPGGAQNYAAGVDSDGSLYYYGYFVYYYDGAVRPALWVNLAS